MKVESGPGLARKKPCYKGGLELQKGALTPWAPGKMKEPQLLPVTTIFLLWELIWTLVPFPVGSPGESTAHTPLTFLGAEGKGSGVVLALGFTAPLCFILICVV